MPAFSMLIRGFRPMDTKICRDGDGNFVDGVDEIRTLLLNRGLVADTRITETPSREDVLNRFSYYAESLHQGDYLAIYYLGHGLQGLAWKLRAVDSNENHSVITAQDVASFLQSLRAGVRVVVFSDSCHKGAIPNSQRYLNPDAPPHLKAIKDNSLFVRPTMDHKGPESKKPVASAILLSACDEAHQISIHAVCLVVTYAKQKMTFNKIKSQLRRTNAFRSADYDYFGPADPEFEALPAFSPIANP